MRISNVGLFVKDLEGARKFFELTLCLTDIAPLIIPNAT